VLDLTEMMEEARRLSRLIDKGVEALHSAGVDLAETENAYRLKKAKAWMTAEGTLSREREAHVDAIVADLRLARDLADNKRSAALEALRSRRTQLSALQSVLAAARSEMELGK
jgi:hypothetical protein